VSFPPHLLDELARLFARAAVDRFVQESGAQLPNPKENVTNQPQSQSDSDSPKDRDIDANSDHR
jgi:hypothetical protein